MQNLIVVTNVLGDLATNCYTVVNTATREAIIIDPAANAEFLLEMIKNQQYKLIKIFLTHGHFDHCIGNEWVNSTYGLSPEIGGDDVFLLNKMDEQVMMFFGVKSDIGCPRPSKTLKDGDTISFGTHQLLVMATPGHTPGGVVFYCEAEKVVFTGDTLFRMSMGRTDLEGGNWQDICQTLTKVIATLPHDTTAYCGHGPETTIGYEVRHNPCLR